MTSKQRILLLNRCYWPDSEATGQLLTDLCAQLSSQYEVHVVCGQPNSPLPGASFKPVGIQVHDDIVIHRLRHTTFAKRVPAGRFINLLSFTRAASKYLRRSKLPADVVVSETDPFLLPMVGASHARRVGARFVSYLQDIYPDVAEAIGKIKPGWTTNQIRSRLQRAYRQADRIVVLGTCMRDRLLAQPWSLPPDRIAIIPNWADCQGVMPISSDENPFRIQHDLQGQFVVMHSGNMGLTQQLDVLVRATKEPSWPNEAVLLLVGDGAARNELEQQVESLQANRVRFLPYQPREKLAESLSAADLHVVSMHENIAGCLCPSKLYGILAAQRPVLAIASETTDLCRCVKTHQLGWCCRPGEVAAISQFVADCTADRTLGRQAGQRARQIALTHYDRDVVTKQFSAMIDDVLTGNHCREPFQPIE